MSNWVLPRSLVFDVTEALSDMSPLAQRFAYVGAAEHLAAHGALAYLFGINALRASEAAAVRIEDHTDAVRGHWVLQLVVKGNKPATRPLTIPMLRVLRRAVASEPRDRWYCDHYRQAS